MENLTLQWKANDDNFYRIDFNTPIITMMSDFKLFHSFSGENAIGAADVPSDHWYNLPQPAGPNYVRDNIPLLRDFINTHIGTSQEYINSKNTINNIIQSLGVGAVYDGLIKNNYKRSRSKKRSKKRSRSKKIRNRSRSKKIRKTSKKRRRSKKY